MAQTRIVAQPGLGTLPHYEPVVDLWINIVKMQGLKSGE